MKNIKTYESWFNKKNKLCKELVDTFLDDLKDISIENYSETYDDSSISYCFFIKNYVDKKNEIDIFLEEIESICKSKKIVFKYITSIVLFNKLLLRPNNFFITSKLNENLDFIVLYFDESTEPKLDIVNFLRKATNSLGFNFIWI